MLVVAFVSAWRCIIVLLSIRLNHKLAVVPDQELLCLREQIFQGDLDLDLGLYESVYFQLSVDSSDTYLHYLALFRPS